MFNYQPGTKRRGYGLAIAVIVGVLSLSAVSSASAAPRDGGAASYTFAFHDADIAQVSAEILGAALGLQYTVDPAVTGKMSFQIDRRLTREQLLEAFEAALETNGVVLVRQGNGLLVEPRAKAKEAAPLRVAGSGAHGSGYATVAVPLTYATPSEVAKALQSMGPADIVVFVDDKQGLLILGGTGSELESATELVKMFDHSGLEGSKIRFIELQQAAAQTVAIDLSRILEASHASGVTVVPLKRLNGLFVFARATTALDEISRWIEKLDVPSREKTESLWVYHPRNLSADALSAALNGVMGNPQGVPAQSSPSKPGGPGQAGDSGSGSAIAASPPSSPLSTEDDPVRIGVDKQSNTLLFAVASALGLCAIVLRRSRHERISDQELSNLLGYRRKSTVSRVEANTRAPTIKFALACEVVFGERPREMFPALYAGVEDAVMRRAKKLDEAIRDDTSRTAAVKRELLSAMTKRATTPRRL